MNSLSFESLRALSGGQDFRTRNLRNKSFRVGFAYSVKRQNDHSLVSSKVDSLLDTIKWDGEGLAVAIVQNIDTGVILMQGFVNRNALVTTISSKKATFYSKSRSILWTKGETSSNFINVHDIFLDNDRDSIIYLGKPEGSTCHTEAEMCCNYTTVFDTLEDRKDEESGIAMSTLCSLESTIWQRKSELSKLHDGKSPWINRLSDTKQLCSKIREAADELCRTLEENEGKSRATSEMGDLLYQSMVLMAVTGAKLEDVFEVLRQRFSPPVIEEKTSCRPK